MMIFKFHSEIGNILMIVSALPIIIYVFGIQTFLSRKELKSKELPVSKAFYKWNSDELEELRILEIYKEYSLLEDNILEERIRFAKELRDYSLNNPFTFFDRILGFLGKQFLLIIIAFLLFLFKEKPTSDNLYLVFKAITGIMLGYFLIAFAWEFLFKKPFFDNQNSQKGKLKDYAFVLENILLMKKQDDKSKL